MGEDLPNSVYQVVVLVREVIDKDIIAHMKHEAELGVITAQYFYPIRDEHYDDGFGAGELSIIDAETGKQLVHQLINLHKSFLKEIT